MLGGLGVGWTSLCRLFGVALASLQSYAGQVARLPNTASRMLPVLLAHAFRLPMHRMPLRVLVQLRDLVFGHAQRDNVRTNLVAMAWGLAFSRLADARDAAFIDEAGYAEGDSLHEHVRIWRRACSRVSLVDVKGGLRGPPLYGEDAARALRESGGESLPASTPRRRRRTAFSRTFRTISWETRGSLSDS